MRFKKREMSVNLNTVTVIFPKVFQILIYLYKFKNSIQKNTQNKICDK